MKLNNDQFLIVVGTLLALMFGAVLYDRYMDCLAYGGWHCVFK